MSEGKTYLVGERGPELFTTATSGPIASNPPVEDESD